MELVTQAAHAARVNFEALETWRGVVDCSSRDEFSDGLRLEVDYTIRFLIDLKRNRARWETVYTRTVREDATRKSSVPQPTERCLLLPDRLYTYYVDPHLGPSSVAVTTPTQPGSFRSAPHIDMVLDCYRWHELFVHDWLGLEWHEWAWDNGARGSIFRQGELLILDYKFEGRPEHYTIDVSRGGIVVRARTDKGDYTTSRDVEVARIQGVWVPTRIKYADQMLQPPQRNTTRTLVWKENRVNEPVADEEFTLAALGVAPGHTVQDRRTHAISKYQGEPAPPPPRSLARDAPVAARRWWLHAAWIAPPAVALAVIAWLVLRRRRRQPQ